MLWMGINLYCVKQLAKGVGNGGEVVKVDVWMVSIFNGCYCLIMTVMIN